MSRRRPGNGSATLLDMLSNLFYFSLFLARAEREGEPARKRETGREGKRGTPREKRSTPSSTYLLPSAHVDAIFQYRVKRAHPLSPSTTSRQSPPSLPLLHLPLPPLPSPLSPFSLVSSRSFALFSRRKRIWKRGTKREKGKKGIRWAAGAGGRAKKNRGENERESEEPMGSFDCATRENRVRLGENRTFLHP